MNDFKGLSQLQIVAKWPTVNQGVFVNGYFYIAGYSVGYSEATLSDRPEVTGIVQYC